MTARNDITGDAIATKGASDAYRDNYDAIFRKKEKGNVTIGMPEKFLYPRDNGSYFIPVKGHEGYVTMVDPDSIQLNAEESARFLDILENPPAPNEALQEAMAKYFGNSDEENQ